MENNKIDLDFSDLLKRIEMSKNHYYIFQLLGDKGTTRN